MGPDCSLAIRSKWYGRPAVASGWPFLETKTRTQTNPPATSPANADFQIFAGAATPAGQPRTRRHYGLPVIALAATGTGRTRSDPLPARPATWPARSTSSTLRDRAAVRDHEGLVAS
jgi:hypothetical protein